MNKVIVCFVLLLSLAAARRWPVSFPIEGDCLVPLSGLVDEYEQVCRLIAVDRLLDLRGNSSLIRKRDLEIAVEALKVSEVCVEFVATSENRKHYMTFVREFNHIADELNDGTLLSEEEKTLTKFGYYFGAAFSVSQTVNKYFEYFVGALSKGVANVFDYFEQVGVYDLFTFVISMFSPWYPIIYLIVNDGAIAVLAPLMAYTGVDFRLIWIYVLLNVFFPGFVVGAAFGLTVVACIKYKRRTQESFRSVAYTISYFWLFGAFLEISRRWLHLYPNLQYFGYFLFLGIALATFWGRKVLVVEYTITQWRGGVASIRSKPHQISVEVDFPYTLLNPLNRLRMWYVGIPWSTVTDAVFGYFGDRTPVGFVPKQEDGGLFKNGTAVANPPIVAPSRDDLAARSMIPDDAGAALSSNFYAGSGLSTPFKPKRVRFATATAEAKGKNKRGRGHLKNTSRAPVKFRKVNSPFWMSDPDIEVEEIQEWFDDDAGQGWRSIPVDDWDIVTGNLQIIAPDGSVQYVNYDPTDGDDDDFVAESFEIQPGQVISDLTILRCKPRKTVDVPSQQVSEIVAALLKKSNEGTTARFESIEKSLALIAKLLESNGKTNVLPAQPAPGFVNPMAAYAPNGCFHHPDCVTSKSTMVPCKLVCSGSACVHNANCKVIVPEAKSRKDKKKAKKVEPSDEASASTRDSAVATNPLVETPTQILYSVVVVEGVSSKAFGVYTDRGVLTQSHIVAGSETIKVYPPYAPANVEAVPQGVVLKVPGDSDLILLPVKVSNCTPVEYKAFGTLSRVTNSPTPKGAISCPLGTVTGVITYKPDCPEELLINGGTKAGMCGSPYIVNQKIVGLHAFGNNNGKDNGAYAVTPELLKWLAAQPKN